MDFLSGGIGQDAFHGHGSPIGGNTGIATDVGNFDTYKDEFDLTKPIHKKAEAKDVAATELGIQAALAGLAAVANNQTNFPIAGRIRYLGTGEYLVKVGPDEEITPDPASPSPVGWVKVKFDGTWTDNDPRPSALERFLKARDSREFWTVLLHRAVTHTFNETYDPFRHYFQADYEALDSRLTEPGTFIEGLTGDGTTSAALALSPPEFEIDAMKASLKLGDWLSALASPTAALAGIADGQAYAITKVFTKSGVDYITLYNPSGFDRGLTATGALDQSGRAVDDGFITISATEFFNNFETGYVN
jgi:hypothetical protein